MSQAHSIQLSPELAGAALCAAMWRGMSLEQYVREVVKTASALDAELAADIKEDEDDLAAGRFHTQEKLEAIFNVRRERRAAA